MVWEVETTGEYDAWFLEQAENEQGAIRMKVELLTEYGPQLPRPHADTLKGSRLSNLKELRAQTENHVLRVAFIFDCTRRVRSTLRRIPYQNNNPPFRAELLMKNVRPFCLSEETRKVKTKNVFIGI